MLNAKFIGGLVLFLAISQSITACEYKTTKTDAAQSSDKETTPPNTSLDSESVSIQDTTSIDSDLPKDTETTTDTDSVIPLLESIFCLPENLNVFLAENDFIYMATPFALLKGTLSSGLATSFSTLPYGISDQCMVATSESLYWLGDQLQLVSYNKSSEESTTTELSVPPLKGPSLAMGAQDHFFVADAGCSSIIRINIDGSNEVLGTLPFEGDMLGTSPIAFNKTHIFCGGGSGGSSNGKLFRVPISSGDIEEIATVTIPNHVMAFQVGGMVAFDTTLYYLEISAKSALKHRLVSVSLDNFEMTILVDLDESSGRRLLYDSTENALYWAGLSSKSIYKYSIALGILTQKQLSIDTIIERGLASNGSHFFIATGENCVLKIPVF